VKKPRLRRRRRKLVAFSYEIACDNDGDITVIMTQGDTTVRFCVEADDAYDFASDILRKYDVAVGIAPERG
jgi:hypothetical protein